MKFLDWMSTPPGRAGRVARGAARVARGRGGGHGPGGVGVALFGLLPLTTAVVNVCPIRPLVGLFGSRPTGERSSR